jgi:hypothetical protein
MTRSTTLGLLFLAPALLAAPDARAELATWNQEKVTAIAEEISHAAQALRGALRRQPPSTLGQPGRRAFWALRDEMQVIVSSSRRLHDALSQGETMEETYPVYRRLLRTARRADRETRQIGLGKPVPGKIDAIADAIRRIRPYYEEDPPL